MQDTSVQVIYSRPTVEIALVKAEKNEQIYNSRTHLILRFLARQSRKIIVGSADIGNLFLAHRTAMQYHPALLRAMIDAHWFHQSTARRSPVTRPLIIDMFGIQTARTVVAIRTRREGLYDSATMFTCERFLAGYERVQRRKKREKR